jgi:membrane-bound lytic murein transglycosylase D
MPKAILKIGFPLLILILSLVGAACIQQTPAPRTEPPFSGNMEEEVKTKSDAATSTEGIKPEQEILQADLIESNLEQSAPEDKSPTPAEYLEEAMNAYRESLRAWDRGHLDEALTYLDAAYSLIINLDLPSDSPFIQGKNDLRLLIAQRIQEIYASRAGAIGENHGSIPLMENKYVQQEIKSFQTKEKKSFLAAYQRSGRYKDMILSELRKEGLPEELVWMPMIESWFKVRAYSRARALGLWQFISSTGYRFGLKRDRWIDERMDPIKSTRAAVKYLKELHSYFGDWTTALAAYNCGEFRVQRVIKNQRINYLDNFWDLYPMLPRETSRFVPRFIATNLIINNPEKYGMNLPEPEPPLIYCEIPVTHPINLASLSQKIGLPEGSLAEMNPELRHHSTPDQAYMLKVPVALSDNTAAAVKDLPRWIPAEATHVIHYVRRGETVSQIASRYGTSISAIGRLNNLGGRYLIRSGQRLKVPGRGAPQAASVRSRPLSKEEDKFIYEVRRGDSLYVIANSFNTSVNTLKNLNKLSSNLLKVGQKLVIREGAPAGAEFHVVKSGDTPYEIAQKYRMRLQEFLAINGLTARSKIYPGQKVWINPIGNDSKE